MKRRAAFSSKKYCQRSDFLDSSIALRNLSDTLLIVSATLTLVPSIMNYKNPFEMTRHI